MIAFLVLCASVAFVSGSDCRSLCPLNYQPLCGSDGLTYDNLCELEAHNCLSKSMVTVVREGECDQPRKQTNEEEKEKECTLMCQRIYDPVCGSDGRTYTNTCELEAEACVRKSSLQLAYKGTCGGQL